MEKKAKVLVLEDNQEMLELYRLILEPRARVTCINTLDERFSVNDLIHRVRESDLVISDAGMLHAKLEVVSHSCRTFRVPLLVISGRDEDEIINAFHDRFLPKPFEPKSLLREIEEALNLSV